MKGLQLGWLIALWLTLGLVGGHGIDQRLGWAPFGILAGALMAMLACAWSVYRAVKDLDHAEKFQKKPKNPFL